MKLFLPLIVVMVIICSCQKEYVCVCTSEKTGEKTYGEKVKTTNLGRKGFEKSCKANNDTISKLKDCHLE